MKTVGPFGMTGCLILRPTRLAVYRSRMADFLDQFSSSSIQDYLQKLGNDGFVRWKTNFNQLMVLKCLIEFVDKGGMNSFLANRDDWFEMVGLGFVKRAGFGVHNLALKLNPYFRFD